MDLLALDDTIVNRPADDKMTHLQAAAYPDRRGATVRLGRCYSVRQPAPDVSRILGHASVDITYRLYAHAVPQAQQQAVEAMERIMGRSESTPYSLRPIDVIRTQGRALPPIFGLVPSKRVRPNRRLRVCRGTSAARCQT